MHRPSLSSSWYRLCLRRPWWHWSPCTWNCQPPSMSLFPTFRLVLLLILTFSTLQFSALDFKPTWAELSSYFVVLCWRWFIEVDSRAMTSAKSRSYEWSSIEFWFVFLCMLHHPVSYRKEQESWQVIHIFEKKIVNADENTDLSIYSLSIVFSDY